MSDILERLQYMFFRFGRESETDAANRRIQTAKDAADEIKKLRAALKDAADALHYAGQNASSVSFGSITFMAEKQARAALGEKE